MKPRSVFPRAAAPVSLLVAALSVGCGSDEALGLDAQPDVIGVLERVRVLRQTSAIDAILLIGELVVPDWDVDPRCEPVCRKLWLRIWDLDETPIFVIEAHVPMRRGGLNDMATGDTIWGWHTGFEFRSLPPQYDATRIVVVKPGSSL
jgi:hypothetical protein